MIKKMIHRNFNRSMNTENDSKKRLNYITDRIKSLEKDINEIKNKENLTLINPKKKVFITPNNDSKILNYSNDINFTKNNSLYSDYNINNSYVRRKLKLNDKKIFNKMNNQHNTINENKNIILKIINADLNKNNQKNKKNIKYRTSNNNTINKIRHFFSFNRPFLYNVGIQNENNNKNELGINHYNNNNKNNITKLEYEYEIRNLKRKLVLLKNENKEINKKLDNIKIINDDIEKDIEDILYQEQTKENIINNLYILNEQFMEYNNENELENKDNNNNILFENIALNIMDIKYFYENNKMIDNFIEGVNKLLKSQLLYQNNDYNDNHNIFEKINELIDTKNNLENNINKYKYLLKENHKYYIYFISLLHKLNLNNIKELFDFIQQIYINNINENNHMKKLQITLMDGVTSPSNRKENKRSLYSSNRLTNSFSQKINVNNFSSIHSFIKSKNSDSKLRQKSINNYLESRRKPHNLTQKELFKTEQIDSIGKSQIININNRNNNKIYNSFYKINNSNNSFLYTEKSANSYYSKKRRKIKININNYNNRNEDYNGGKKVINLHSKKNNLFNNEEDIGNIKYFDNNDKNKYEKFKTNNVLRKNNFYNHVKNRSAILFNK